MARARKAALASRLTAKKLDIRPGDQVLIGRSGTSQPGDWFIATVLLVVDAEVATEHYPASNWGAQRQFLPLDSVRAVSADHLALSKFKERCRQEIAEHSRKVYEATQALGAARDQMWAALDAIGASAPQRLDHEVGDG